MTVAVRKPWTQDEFFTWTAAREGRFEFDGSGPLDVTGGSFHHSLIMLNVIVALRSRLQGTAGFVVGPDMGLQTIGQAIRYPDVVVSFARPGGSARILLDATVVFEVLSPTTERTDRTAKVVEYGSVPSLRRYCLIESEQVGLSVFSRSEANALLTQEVRAIVPDRLVLPELGLSIPISELYDGVDFAPGA